MNDDKNQKGSMVNQFYSGIIDNKLGITNQIELDDVEEKISKKRAKELYEKGIIDKMEIGTFRGLSDIHKYLFSDIYNFAGKIRTVNIAKGVSLFAHVFFLETSIENVEKMSDGSFDEIVQKYVEMNIVHPFREGNGRSMCIWLDAMMSERLNKVIDWNTILRDDYMLAIKESPTDDSGIKRLFRSALVENVNDSQILFRNIDVSYCFEGYSKYLTKKL
jgi:cell filamentation protein